MAFINDILYTIPYLLAPIYIHRHGYLVSSEHRYLRLRTYPLIRYWFVLKFSKYSTISFVCAQSNTFFDIWSTKIMINTSTSAGSHHESKKYDTSKKKSKTCWTRKNTTQRNVEIHRYARTSFSADYQSFPRAIPCCAAACQLQQFSTPALYPGAPLKLHAWWL